MTLGLPLKDRETLWMTNHHLRTVLFTFLPDLVIPKSQRRVYSERAVVCTFRQLGAQYYTMLLHDLDDPYDRNIKAENYSVVTGKRRTFYRRSETHIIFKAEIDNSREISVLCVWESAGKGYLLSRLTFCKPEET